MECVDLTCTECGADYSSKKKLEHHKKSVHTLLKCDECNKQVVGYKNMRNHKQNHVMKVCQHCDIDIRKIYKMKTPSSSSSSSRSLTPSPLSRSLSLTPSPLSSRDYSVAKRRSPFDQNFIERYPAAIAAHNNFFNK